MKTRAAHLYPASRKPFSSAMFARPDAQYRGYPFWCWNTRLDKRELLRHVGIFETMGMGGMTIHCRTGLDTPYMGPEFMERVRVSVAEARKRGLFVWLYDEDRWPSGYGGGLVTRDPAHRAKHLLWTCRPYTAGQASRPELHVSTAGTGRTGQGTLLHVYDVVLDRAGCLRSARRVRPDARPRGRLWYAYLETAVEQPWFNHQTYVDTLSGAAIKRFIETTHEVYRRHLQDDFGTTVPAIFTDEPQFPHKQAFGRADADQDLVIPFTSDFFETYRAAYGEDLADALPEIFWELPAGRPSLARYRYHDHLAERFAAAFADTIGTWCHRHGIALTGHLMEEPTLQSQTHALGEAMRSYRSFDVPGVDILCDHHPHTTGHPLEFTTVKQAQSAARQHGCPGVLSEIYGVTNWDFTFAGHKAQGDWQAALGVTVRVHHLALVSMAGEAKRDYPASIFYQSPWHAEYGLIEGHFARVNAALTRGRPVVRVGVVHPIESFWLCFGPLEQTRPERNQREEQFANLTRWLVHGLVDFDFVCESLLPAQCPAQRGVRLRVGRMAYDVVIVPPMRTIRATTLERLEAFVRGGGTLIFAGEIPSLVDARPSPRAALLAQHSRRVPFEHVALMREVEPVREVGVYGADGALADGLACQMRRDGSTRFVFICNTDRAEGPDANVYGTHLTVRLRGAWDVEELDSLTGRTRVLPSTVGDGVTKFERLFVPAQSLLLRLRPARVRSRKVALRREPVLWQLPERARLSSEPMPVRLSEPNALLLDLPAWRVNDGPWHPRRHVLHLENLARGEMGLAPKDFAMAQPWTDTAPTPETGTITLRHVLRSEVRIAMPVLALENIALSEIYLNGCPVPVKPAGWWVDRCLQTVALPAIPAGESILELRTRYHRKVDLEASYLLGDFGVRLAGTRALLTAPVRSLAFGDWSTQGLPFYAGNVTYRAALAIPQSLAGRPLLLEFGQWAGPLLRARLDGSDAGVVAFPPWTLRLPALRAGTHALELTVYGNRYNAFGNVHYRGSFHWNQCGSPDSWRVAGRDWSDAYALRPIGILSPPILRDSA